MNKMQRALAACLALLVAGQRARADAIDLLPFVAGSLTTAQDADCPVAIAFQNSGTPIDLTGLSFVMQWHLSAAPTSPNDVQLTAASTPNSYLRNGGATGVVSLNLPQPILKMLPARTYVADLIATNASARKVVVGQFSITHSALGPCLISDLSTTARNAATADSIGYVPGPQGIPGAVGPMGPMGPMGPIGATGPMGAAGPANTLAIGSVTTGAAGTAAAASLAGSPPNQTLSLTIPSGATGATGPANSLAIGTVTTGSAGSSASATLTGAAPAQTLNLTIPQGTTGATGPQPWATPPTAWAPSTVYTATAPASVVTYGGSSYVALTSHTSSASFDASKWTMIAQSGNTGSLFSGWTYNGGPYVLGTTYHAATDLIVVAWVDSGSGAANAQLSGLTDSSTSPTHTVCATNGSAYSAVPSVTCTFPVKKGDYWMITSSAGATYGLNVMSVGN